MDYCYTYTQKVLKNWKEVKKEFGDSFATKIKLREFIGKLEEPRIIPIEELGNHEVAFFENNEDIRSISYETGELDPNPGFRMEDIMYNFEVDTMKGLVKAKKLYRFNGDYYLVTRKYKTEDYGKTWRAWTGIPREKYVF